MKGKRTFIKAGRLLDGTGGAALAQPVVVVEGGRIADVYSGSLPDAPDGEVLDLGQATVMPGMWDVHCHIRGSRAYSPGEAVMIPHDVKVLRAAEDCRKMLWAGITSARDCGSTIALSLARAVNDGSIPGPNIWAAGKIITQTGGHGDTHYLPVDAVRADPAAGGRLADGPYDCRQAVREMLRLGADFIKIATSGGVGSEKSHPTDERFTIPEIHAITDEAHRFGKRVASHAQGTAAIKNALKCGVDTIEHGYMVDEECIDLMLKQGVFHVPTIALLNVFKESIKRPHDMPPWRLRKQREQMERMEPGFRRSYEAGVKIATGPDYLGVPMRAHGDNADEPIAMVQYGMKPADAIVATTLRSAECVGVESEYGTITRGKHADVIGLRGDPLEDISQLKTGVFFVMKSGCVFRQDP